jgi:hypothetical protein
MSWIKRLPSPSLVISIIALCLALGGTAFALAQNSVGARELKATVLKEQEHSVAAGETRTLEVKCGKGQQLISGGIEVLGGHVPALQVEDSHPHGNSWEATVRNTGSAAHDVGAEALCLKK